LLFATRYSLLAIRHSLLTSELLKLLTVLLAPVGEPSFVLRPFVHAAAFGTDRRGGHDRELVGADYLDTGGDSMAGRGAFDHHDTHDLLLYPIGSNTAQNLGNGVADYWHGWPAKIGTLVATGRNCLIYLGWRAMQERPDGVA
jgi:hypothetical protein